MTSYLFELFLLWSAIFTYDFFVCAVGPRLRLANGRVLSNYEEVTIEYGNPLELLCTGNAAYLKMTKNGAELAIDTVNKTTVRFFAEHPERQNLYYYCDDSQINNGVGVKIIVDSTPLITDFHCKSKNLDYLNCTWASLNVVRKFSLYYMEGELLTSNFLLCKLGVYDSMYCIWDSKNPTRAYQKTNKKLTFMMKTCNYLGCSNQTFAFNHVDIIQPDTPKLDLLRISSHSVDLVWSTDVKLWPTNLSVEYRISYWYSGVHQIQVNTSSLEDIYMSTFELKLPCAGTFYEVRLSVRPKTAVGEEFWSEDAVLYFVTDPEPEDVAAAADPTCTRPRVTITPGIMLYEIEKFRDKMEKEQKELKESLKPLRFKRFQMSLS